VDSLEETWFLGIGCTRSIPSQYRFLASKASDKGIDNRARQLSTPEAR
jgi:hypothetical protein